MQPPRTQYVERDGVSIAYQVFGDGPIDLLLAPGFISHLDLQWTDPGLSKLLGRLARFARLILYDKAGTGLSDPVAHLPTLEERGADIEAVLDAAGSERAVLFGLSEGGPASVLLAATRPERIISLVLYGTFAVLPFIAPDAYAPGVVERAGPAEERIESIISNWGDGASLAEVFAPSMGEHQQRFWGTFARAAASPRMADALLRTLMHIDVREVLPSVRVPTLVLHLEGDRAVPIEAGELLADRIPGANFVSYPGVDHAFWLGRTSTIIDELADEIERFVTGTVRRAETDRVLATVLFTDIVASTTRASELGDRAWRELLERHDATLEGIVTDHGGRVVKHIGDGALSVFDGPAKAIRCAENLRDAVDELGIQLRAGVHTGECEVVREDLAGLSVHIGARIGALAQPGEIAVSSTVKELVIGSDMDFTDRGEHELKGVPGAWRVYGLRDRRSPRPELDGPSAHMRRSDRVVVSLARRVPRTMRLAGQLAARRASAA